jgi:hypothetical protein
MSYRSRLYNHRNAQSPETTGKKPFFAKQHEANDTNNKSAFFQAKLSVNDPGDHYEHEADNVANAVVNNKTARPVVKQKQISSVQRLATSMEDEKLGTNDARMERDKDDKVKSVQRAIAPPEKEKDKPVQKMGEPEKDKKVQKKDEPKKDEERKGIQRVPAGPEREKDKPVQKMGAPEKEKDKIAQKKDEPKKEEENKEGAAPVQKKPEGGGPKASQQLSNQIENSAGKGKSLPAKTLKEMNSSFGADFDNVSVHHDGESASMNRELQAQAFTHGRDIYFNSGKYNPDTSEGKFLLAHELTHVVQQQAGIRKQDDNDATTSAQPASSHPAGPINTSSAADDDPNPERLQQLDDLEQKIAAGTEESHLIRQQLDSITESSPENQSLQDQLNAQRLELISLLEDRIILLNTEISSLNKRIGANPVSSPDNPEADALGFALIKRNEELKINQQQLRPLQRWQMRRQISAVEDEISAIDTEIARLPPYCDPDDPTLDLLTARKAELEAEKKTLAKSLTAGATEYEQWDSRWGAIRYGQSPSCSNIKEAGCGPTSLAIVLNYLYQEDPESLAASGNMEIVTPPQTAAYAATNGRVCNNGTAGDTMVSNVNTGFPGFSGKKITLTQAAEQIRSGDLVIFLCKDCKGKNVSGGDKSYGGHFMVLNGVNDDSSVFTVLDPGANESKDIETISYDELQKHTGGFWMISRI